LFFIQFGDYLLIGRFLAEASEFIALRITYPLILLTIISGGDSNPWRSARTAS
jgi:hypothetical protein